MRTPQQDRLLMIAVDAGELSFVRAWRHKLPVFQRLLEEGTLCKLRSSAEYATGSVWPTMYTGKPLGEHGITQHIQWDPRGMRMRRVTSDWIYNEPFWYDLTRAGLGVVTLDVPFLFENRLPDAIEVINWGSHDLMGTFGANSPSLRRDIRRRFGSHPMGYEIPVSKDTHQLVAMKHGCVIGAEAKGKLACWLRDTTKWDFYLAVFGECHRAGHILWRDHDEVHAHVPEGALLEVYQAVDAAIGTVLDGLDLETTTVVVFSLHGMGPNFSQEHFVRRAMDRINANFFHDTASRNQPLTSRRGLIRALRESIPPSLQHTIGRAVPVEVRDWVVSREVTGGLDWSRTPGFALRSDLYSFLRLNVVGRECLGILERSSETWDRYIDHVMKCLQALRAVGTDAPIVRDVLLLQEVFPGSRQHLLPDLLVRWTEEYPVSEVYSAALGLIPGAPDSGRTGEHRSEGFALILGRGAKQERLPQLSHNSDFPRFVRHLLNLGY